MPGRVKMPGNACDSSEESPADFDIGLEPQDNDAEGRAFVRSLRSRLDGMPRCRAVGDRYRNHYKRHVTEPF